jgi:peptidoglycan-associated lipoprotein
MLVQPNMKRLSSFNSNVEVNAMSRFKKICLVTLFVQLAACAGKKAKTDADQAMDPQISNQPLNYTAQGSDTGQISGLTTIHFDYDQATIPKSEAKIVSQDVEWIKSHPGVKVQVEGHCDQRGSVEYNLALGERRAKALANVLVAHGIAKHHLTIISYGKERPINPGDTEEAYAQNRRVNFVPLALAPKTSLSSTAP